MLFFFCRLVREITGKVTSVGVSMCYTSAIAAPQHTVENFLVDLFEHSNILAIHAKWVTILPSDMHTLKVVARRLTLINAGCIFIKQVKV